MSDEVARLEGIWKSYHKGGMSVHALRGVDIVVPRGQYLGIMGPSGSGKSTMMNIIGCLDKPTKGRYLLAGQDVSQMPDEDLSRARGQLIGFVFQGFNLIPQLTVLQNVQVPLFYQGVPRHERDELAMHSIERVGLGQRAHHRPTQLSGGQMQRCAIARALVTKPSLILADEPTGNLDSTTGESILQMFDELHQQGMTIVMVTHDPEVGERCQRVLHLRDGLVEKDILNTPPKAVS